MKASKFFSILCDQILTPIEGMTADEFDKIPPLIHSLLDDIDRADSMSVSIDLSVCGDYLEDDTKAILRSVIKLKDMVKHEKE